MRRMGEGTMCLSLSGPGRATTHGFTKFTASPFYDTTPPPPASHALEKGMSGDTETTWSPSGLDSILSWTF